MAEASAPKRALIVTAHPDDAEFGAAGTVAKWSREGWEFYYLLCTNGSKGTDDPNLPPEKLVPMREREQRAAAAAAGGKDVYFLGYEDGELVYTRELLGRVVRVIREVRPDAVFTHNPETLIMRFGDEPHFGAVNHSDHRCAGLVAVDAVYPAARDALNFPEQIREGLQPHKVSEIYLFGTNRNDSDFAVDITDTLDRKIAALQAHESQMPEGEEFFDRMKTFWRDEDGRYLERFRKVVLPG